MNRTIITILTLLVKYIYFTVIYVAANSSNLIFFVSVAVLAATISEHIEYKYINKNEVKKHDD